MLPLIACWFRKVAELQEPWGQPSRSIGRSLRKNWSFGSGSPSHLCTTIARFEDSPEKKQKIVFDTLQANKPPIREVFHFLSTGMFSTESGGCFESKITSIISPHLVFGNSQGNQQRQKCFRVSKIEFPLGHFVAISTNKQIFEQLNSHGGCHVVLVTILDNNVDNFTDEVKATW